MTTQTASRPQLATAFFGVALIGVISGAWGILLPPLSEFYQVDKAVVGLLFFSSASGYFLSALSSGFLIAKLGMRWYLITGALMFIVSCLLTALKLPFAILFIIRLAQGMSSAIIEAGFNIFFAKLANSSRLLNHLHAYFGAGALVGPIAASAMLAASWGWNITFVAWGALALPLLIGLIFFYPQTRTSEASNEQSKGNGNLLAALKLPIVWIATLFLFFYVGVEVSLGSWGYTFLLENRHESEWLAGAIVSGYWLGLTFGRFVLDALSQRLGLTLSGLMYACMGGIVLGIAILWFIPGSISSVVAFCLIGTALGPIYPCTVSLLPSLVPEHVADSAMGFLIGLSVLGIAFFPWIAGTLAQFTSIWSLLPYNLGLTAIMVAFWWMVQRKRPGEQVQEEAVAAVSAHSQGV